MVLDEIAEAVEKRIRSLEGKVDEYIITVEEVSNRMLKLANGEASVTQNWRTIEVGLYLARRDGRIFYTGLSAHDPEKAAAEAARLVEAVEPSPLYAPLPRADGESYSNVDPKIKAYLEGDIQLDLAGDLELDLVGTAAGMAELGYVRRLFLNSHGDRLTGERTWFKGYMRVFRGDRTGQWSWTGVNYDNGERARKAIQVARGLAEECEKLPLEKIEPGEYRVLLSPMIAGNLVNEVLFAASAARLIFAMTWIKPEMLGQRVVSDKLTIIDAPRRKDLPEYTLHDAEGVKTRDKPVIAEGVLQTLLHNTKTAKLMGTETTGNAGLIMPEPFNIIVKPGDLGEEEQLEALGEGIYVTNNWYTRYQNYVEGTFSTVSRDAVILVKNGKPSACLNRIRITGKIQELFANVEAVGKTRWPMEWWEVPKPTLTPHILISKTKISLPTI